MSINIYNAARGTKNHIKMLVGPNVDLGKLKDPASLKHLNWMLCEICTGRVTKEKAHRWLGYIQGVLVAQCHMTLDEAKEINFKAEEKL